MFEGTGVKTPVALDEPPPRLSHLCRPHAESRALASKS
jgi:hypothetical protein